MDDQQPSLVRSYYAANLAAINRLTQAGLMTPAQAAVARVKAYWDAEKMAAEDEGIDLQAQAEAVYRTVVPGADGN